MDSVVVIRRLHQHRAWVNRNLLEAAALLSEEQLRSVFPIGQGSIWKSLLHLYAAEYVWLEALLGNEEPLTPGDVPGRLPGNQEGGDAIARFDELRQRWHTLELRWTTYLDALQAEALEQAIYKKSTSSGFGKRFGTRRGDVLLHVCTHAQYTTAQVLNMMRNVGVKNLPDVMLITLARSESTLA